MSAKQTQRIEAQRTGGSEGEEEDTDPQLETAKYEGQDHKRGEESRGRAGVKEEKKRGKAWRNDEIPGPWRKR